MHHFVSHICCELSSIFSLILQSISNLSIEFPQSLPVSLRKGEIMQAICDHQVIIVCGETGSGKTTQLPKMALALGRGGGAQLPSENESLKDSKSSPRRRIIGHTQPRRIAATSVAKRIADELNSSVGEWVGYKVRFQDKLSASTRVKLMTDGILLAETQTDPLLKAYDTIIIDEAHERSLNIDFLLGHLKQILPKRPDLKIIVTSATIDADRFARHFASSTGPAPVLMVSGRTYPVEMRYRPFEEERDYSWLDALSDSVDELWRGKTKNSDSDTAQISTSKSGELNPNDENISKSTESESNVKKTELGEGDVNLVRLEERLNKEEVEEVVEAETEKSSSSPSQINTPKLATQRIPAMGDILVFLPGEREIRDAMGHLNAHLANRATTRHCEVVPLFARLTQAEQERVFHTGGAPRIVLATNVAETSLTVPGIRYVIDLGTARIKRYNYRTKVEQLLIEPVSQAAANQRAGRCGRVSEGVCIRLYSADDFNGRPRFTDPEILRSSLASVILRLKSLRFGSVEEFPFLEAPRPKAISDGYQLLSELGAIDEDLGLTRVGSELAKLPLDPRIGRMILEARSKGALSEVLIVASALSVQDVRDRPLEQQGAADSAHVKFRDERSEFNGYLKIWNWVNEQRGTTVDPSGSKTHKLTNRQYENLLKQNFLSVSRLREWRDVYSQLLLLIKEQKWRLNTESPTYEQLHQSLLSGLMGNIGFKSDEQDFYLGARGIKFYRHPGAHLTKKAPKWVVCAELVETTRLFGRGMASIDPLWLESLGEHLLKRQLLDPKFDIRKSEVIAFERATLYGLLVYSGRRVPYARVDMVGAREIFIRQGLVEGQWLGALPFIAANQKMIRKVEELEHKSRRQDVLVDEALIFAYYDQKIPSNVFNAITLERWYKEESQRSSQPLLYLTQEELMRHEAQGVTTDAFPKVVKLGGVDCSATYLHEPADVRDGITVGVPLFVLNQISEERAEWLVPGMLKEKILALLKSLHQKPRARLVPLPDTAERFANELSKEGVFAVGSLIDAMVKLVVSQTQVEIKRGDFKLEMLAPHHFMNFKVEGDAGRQLAMGRNLGSLKAELGAQARGAFQALASLKTKNYGVDPHQSQFDSINNLKTNATKGNLQNPQNDVIKPPGGRSGAGGVFGEMIKDRGLNTRDTFASESAVLQASVQQPSPFEGAFTQWSFGELPELLELSKGDQTLVGFPALIDEGFSVRVEVFDEPSIAKAKHKAGLRKLFALQVKDSIKYLEKNNAELASPIVLNFVQSMKNLESALKSEPTKGGANSSTAMTIEILKPQIMDLALDRAFMMDPWPINYTQFEQRLVEGRTRLTLITTEISRLVQTLLTEFCASARKLKDTGVGAQAQGDIAIQLQRLMHKNFLLDTPYSQLQQFPRYLKAVFLRLDKFRADPARDLDRMKQIAVLEQQFWREWTARKGVPDSRLSEFRWLLEELRVSLFAQELKTPQPVSVKRLEKAWTQLKG